MGYRQQMEMWDRKLRADAPVNGLPVLFLLMLAALLVRILSLTFASGDFVLDISRWQNELHARGFAGIGGEFYNYNPPYLYLLWLGTLTPLQDLYVVKIISILFDVILAVGVGRLIMLVRPNLYHAIFGALVVLLLPEVWWNSALWGQIDAGYTSLLIWMLVAFLSNRHKTGWLLLGFALAFKAQAFFILPLMAVLFLLRRAGRWWHPLLTLVAMVLADIPALIAGRSPVSLLGIYLKQADTYHSLSSNAPNFYQLLGSAPFDVARPIGLVVAVLVIMLLMVLCFRFVKQDWAGFDLHQPLTVLRLGLLFMLLVPFVLPQMHERYFYMPAILAAIITLLDRRYLPVAILLQVANCLAYIPFLFGTVIGQFPYLPGSDWVTYLGVPFMTGAVVLTLLFTFKPLTWTLGGALQRLRGF